MDMLIILTYTALCIATFKLFNIPLNKWSVPTAVLGGIALLATIMIAMNYNHPCAKYAKEVFVSVPIVPEVSGQVEAVLAQPNVPVFKGDILFTLNSDKQQVALRQAEAALEEAKNQAYQNDEQLLASKSQTDHAKASVVHATANRDRARTTYLRYKQAHDKGGINSPFTDQDIDRQREFYLAAEASLGVATAALSAAESDERRLLLVTESKINGENTRVAQLIEKMNQALIDLENTVVRAPSDGTPTQIALRPGLERYHCL